MDPRRLADPRLSRDPRRAQDPRLARVSGYADYAGSPVPQAPTNFTLPTHAPQPRAVQQPPVLVPESTVKQRALFCVVCANNQVSPL
jgi:hypothetical protein